MKIRWLLSALLGVSLGVLPIALDAEAARLDYWRFEGDRNRLYFTTTDGGVQPRARLIANPIRLVIDLPGTTLGRPTVRQPGSGNIREIRVGQADETTARIVVELAPGYTIDPQQVRFRGRSPSEWTVDIPEPQLIDSNAAQFPNSEAALPVPVQPTAGGRSNRDTAQGFVLIRSIDLSQDGQSLVIQADGPLEYTTGWDRDTAAYKITIPQARIADQVRDLSGNASPYFLWVRTRQEAPETAAILVQPAASIRVEVSQPQRDRLQIGLFRYDLEPPANNLPPVDPERPDRPIPDNIGRLVVVLDPGHGGRDPGAIGIGGLREKDITTDVALQVAAILEQSGIQVVLTRRDDRDLDLDPRVQIAERAGADLFVSIHANAISLSRPDVNGIETYYYFSRSLALAQTMHRYIVQASGGPDRGVRQARFYVIRNTSMPAVLLELGFVTGARDAPKLADPNYRRTLAEAIANGILEYVRQTY